MVVVPEPAVKGSCPFAAGLVDGAVGPFVEHRADEALGFAVGLWSAWACAEVSNAKPAAADGVEGGDVGAAVVGQDRLDSDPVRLVEGDGALEEAERG